MLTVSLVILQFLAHMRAHRKTFMQRVGARRAVQAALRAEGLIR